MTTASAPICNGRAYQPFKEPVPMKVNGNIKIATVLSVGQIVWAVGEDDQVLAIAYKKDEPPDLRVSRTFLDPINDD